jgi:hypothetical protein
MAAVRSSPVDRVLRPLHRWIWRDPHRRARKLLRFAQTEADGGRDLSRAAELTSDALLRGVFLRHACDEQRHAELFQRRGAAMLRELPRASGPTLQANWLAPGERGLDDLRVEPNHDDSLLAFLHLSEKAAAGRFAVYHQVLSEDPDTRAVFTDILRDEVFHMNYTRIQLARISPEGQGLRLWQARLGRVWKGYLRVAAAIAGLLGTALLLLQYFLLLPPFALAARRAARREPKGWFTKGPPSSLQSQY